MCTCRGIIIVIYSSIIIIGDDNNNNEYYYYYYYYSITGKKRRKFLPCFCLATDGGTTESHVKVVDELFLQQLVESTGGRGSSPNIISIRWTTMGSKTNIQKHLLCNSLMTTMMILILFMKPTV
mmetsp:Transcript_39432/g.45088  ORF Transcript_39432/g.45088 Transcript_39432/m.45088 type:complete len:124 (-) Transcript_39432:160-531(-)